MTLDYQWSNLISYVLSFPPHQNVTALKIQYVHPSQVGFYRSVGEPHNQIADWRLRFSDDPRCIHALEYQDCYLVHWDYRDPTVDPWGHIQYDAPQYGPLVAMGAIVGLLGLVAFLDSHAA
jgi:hypothetical protein